MAFQAYVGLMGSGKSYEVVKSAILPALKSGRRVVSNISGLNFDLIKQHLVDQTGANANEIGELIVVTNDDVNKVGFFPDETKPDQASMVQPGDFIAIDEVWQFWSTDHKISDEHMRFLRMHRHYIHPETSVSCDIAVMIQDLSTLHRKYRAVIEMTYRTVKLKTVGRPTNYRIEIYEGNKTTKQAKVDTYLGRYDQKIFPLYKSYAGGAGVEQMVDKRQNIIRNPRVGWMIFLGIIVLILGGWYLYRFFYPNKPITQSVKIVAPSQTETTPLAHKNSAEPQSSENQYSEQWRFVGKFTGNGLSWVVLSDSSGRLRLESPSVFTGNITDVIGLVEDKKVTAYTGNTPMTVFGQTHGGVSK